MRSPFMLAELPRSAWLLVGANALALVGVLFFGWELGDILLLYWLESAIIGLYTVLKMLSKRSWSALFFVPFFCVHYGIFMSVHFVFLLAFLLDGGLFGTMDDANATLVRIAPVALGLVASHGASFQWNWLERGEREGQPMQQIMFSPYPRIVVMHLTIIVGGMLVAAVGAPVLALVVLLVLKSGVDLVAHQHERRKAYSRRPKGVTSGST